MEERMTIEPGKWLSDMRAARPLVQCVTNFVAMEIAANVLLAAGASPAMVHAPEESGDFAAVADALTINIGTLSPYWLDGMAAAAQGARDHGKPWVLDPVAVFATGFRRDACERLLALRPTVIRGNASEILALAGAQAAGAGADAGDPVEAAAEPAAALARRTGAVVAVTGPVDLIIDGARVARVANGAPVMPQVTALGCALTCLTGAFVAAGDDTFAATVAALAFYGLAGERAAARTAGPGSFPPAFLDELAALTPASLDAGARIA
jgi:hydroxyethylthiazole kinase